MTSAMSWAITRALPRQGSSNLMNPYIGSATSQLTASQCATASGPTRRGPDAQELFDKRKFFPRNLHSRSARRLFSSVLEGRGAGSYTRSFAAHVVSSLFQSLGTSDPDDTIKRACGCPD